MSNLGTSALRDEDVDLDDGHTPEPLSLAPDPVEVRRNGGLAALLGVVGSAVAIAYLARATTTGSVVDWALAAALGALGVGHLRAFVDARTPLLVADTQGVRVRLGRTWRGLPWGALARVEHTPRRGLLRDGRLVLVAYNAERVLGELDRRGRRQTTLTQKLYGAPFAVPLALSTRVTGAGEDLTAALTHLAGAGSTVVEVVPVPTGPDVDEEDLASEDLVEETTEHDGLLLRARALVAHALYRTGGVLQRERDAATDETDESEELDEEVEGEDADEVVASETPSPLREPVAATRAEVRRDLPRDLGEEDEGGREQRRPGSVNLVEDTVVWSERVRPIAAEGDRVAPLTFDDFDVEPADDPVIGPELAAARTRLRLTVDQLAERTRIRPHVIEAIEVDDFAPCGGDFYARGHLRTLARVLGVDAAPLLTAYDDRYSDAPINPRRVFEAELAAGSGSIRGTRGGPNWSVLVATVMALVLAWSIARLVLDTPVTPHAQLHLNGSPAGPTSTKLADPVPVVLDARGGGAHVVMRDGGGAVVFTGNLAFGESKAFKVAPPVRIQTSDGSLTVSVAGQDRGPIGTTGQPAQNTFVAD
ncbi:MAG TPA: helix-turn-helix domain-containing protein [Nocardioides sp.]|nr:helix-turn-helix domain-containing protein [Nocardioides sp.]